MESEQSLSLTKTSWTFIPLFQHDFVSHTLSREILGSEALWPWLLASSGLSALVQLVTLPFFPDSPSYLLIQKGNEEACRKGRVNAFLTYFPSSALSQREALQRMSRAELCCTLQGCGAQALSHTTAEAPVAVSVLSWAHSASCSTRRQETQMYISMSDISHLGGHCFLSLKLQAAMLFLYY